MTAAIYTGHCFCGEIRYRVTGPAKNLCFCHCESCRRAAGAPFIAWGTFDRYKFTLLDGQLTQHRSSPQVTRGFCNTCGTSLTYYHDARDEDIDVTLVTLDDSSSLTPEYHIWLADKLPWIKIQDGLPQYARYRADDA